MKVRRTSRLTSISVLFMTGAMMLSGPVGAQAIANKESKTPGVVMAATAERGISVSPASGPSGTKVTITGQGWTGYDAVEVQWSVQGSGAATRIGSAAPDDAGTFDIEWTVPDGMAPADLRISAIIGNGGSEDANCIVTAGGGPP